MSDTFVVIEPTGYALVTDTGTDTLATLQLLVDGLVECVTPNPKVLGFTADVWVNEEGLYRSDFSINLLASYLTGRQLVGPAVLARSTSHGRTVGLTERHLERLTADSLFLDYNDGKNWTAEEVVARREEVEG
jgi:hypothetical protein